MRVDALDFRSLQVPDTRGKCIAEGCRRQSREAAKHRRFERETLDWIEHVSDVDGWSA